MTWYAVIKSATGEAVSFGTSVGDRLPAGLEVLVIDHQPGKRERWDETTRAVVSRPPTNPERLADLRAKGWTNLTTAEKNEATALRFDLGIG